MHPDELLNFVDYIKDLKGHITALMVNYLGAEERLSPYLHNLNMVGKTDIDPLEFYEMLLALRKELDILSLLNERCYKEVQPCVKVLDELRGQF